MRLRPWGMRGAIHELRPQRWHQKFSFGESQPRESRRSHPEAEAIYRFLTAETVTIGKFHTIHLLILDQYVSRRREAKQHFGKMSPQPTPPLCPLHPHSSLPVKMPTKWPINSALCKTRAHH